ncbi:MAG: glycosyltransferase [Candidatus Neomarinimicrobiota bacterium]
MSFLKPVISIVTPTYNRKDELIHLIKSIQKQSLSSKYFEMIISDDGSTDGTSEIVKKWQKENLFNLIYVFQKNLGPGSARNSGVKSSNGELIVFIDSDCEADVDWLQNIYRSYKNNDFDAFGGPDQAKKSFLPIQRAINFSMTSFLTTGGMRGHNKNMVAKFYPRSHNMGVKKELFDKVGGFGSLRHGQDIELSNRIIKENAKVKLLENVIVYHRRRTTLMQFFRQVFNWGAARINLAKMDGNMLQIIHFVPSLATSLAFIVILGFVFYPKLFLNYIIAGFLALCIICIYGGLKTRSFLVSSHLFLVVPMQIFGYGLGFIIAFIKRFILKQKLFTGFQKKYY